MNATTNATDAGTRKVLATASLAALLVLPATRLAAADLTVDSPMTVTTDNTYGNVSVSNVLTIASPGKITANTSVAIGDSGRIAITEHGSLVVPTTARLTVSGRFATPAITLTGNLWDKVFPYKMTIADTAETDDVEIDFMRLEGAFNTFPNMFEMRNDNAKPAVVTFAGGSLSAVNSSTTGFYLPNAGTKIILRGENGKPIRLLFGNWDQNSVWHLPYSSNLGTVQTEGASDVLFDGRERDYYGGTVSFNAPYTDSRLVWNHTGDFIFTNSVVKTTVDNALPYSATAARTLRFGLHKDKVPTPTEYSGIDLCGHSSKVGSLFLGEGTFVTNSAATVGTLVLGADGQHSVFSGTTRGNVVVECASDNYEITSGSDVAKLRANSLPINIASGAVVREIAASNSIGSASASIAAGETVDVTGFRTEPLWTWDRSYTNYYNGQTYSGGQRMNGGMPFVLGETGLSNGLHRVGVAAGGTAVVNVDENCEFEYLKVSGDGVFRKTGSGRATLVGNGRLTVGRTEVNSGTLAVQGAGCTNEWYRLTVTESHYNPSYMTIGKIGLFGEAGDWLCLGSSFQPSKTEAELLPGECTVGTGLEYDNENAKGKYYPGHLFVADYAYYGAKFTNRSSSSPAITVTFRLPAASAPALWHSIGSVDNRGNQPRGWKLETSANGGDGWTEVVSVSQELVTKSENWYYWRNDRRYNEKPWNSEGTQKSEGLPWRLALNNAIATGNTLGIVRVDSGATLDLTGSDGAGMTGLEIDIAAGGGTVRGAAIPVNGTLALVNVPAGTNLYGPVLLALDGASGTANFKNWTVTVNGRAKDCRIQIDENGALTLAAEATVILMR